MFCDLKKFNAKDQKMTVITLTFSITDFENIKKSHTLSNTAFDIIHLINSFGNKT